jgi:hypothetical protein
MSETLAYTHLRSGRVARTVQVTASAMVDLDGQDRLLGVETLSSQDWRSVLATLAMSGRLTIPQRGDLWPGQTAIPQARADLLHLPGTQR